MKTGLIITAFNRPMELAECLVSLRESALPEDLLTVIVDDCSHDLHTKNIVKGFELPGKKVQKIFMPRNRGVRFALKAGYEFLWREGCEVVINLDSDAVIKSHFFINLLRLHSEFPDRLVSGFNSNNERNHPVLKQHPYYVEKANVGGINMVATKELYQKYILPALLAHTYNWDSYACGLSMKEGKTIIVARPSVVQHISKVSTMRHYGVPDKAIDWDETEPLIDVRRIIPLQAFGLGDIIFTIHIARKYWLPQAPVTWPVLPHFLDGCRRAYPDIEFADFNDYASEIDYEDRTFRTTVDGTKIIPIRWAAELQQLQYRHVMRAKYSLLGLDWKHWKEGAMFTRDKNKEQELLDSINPTGEPFNLINRFFRSDSSGRINVQLPQNGYRNIEMKPLDGFSLFDWSLALEHAAQIHTVSTSIIYVLELLGLRGHIYMRRPDERSHANYDYILERRHVLRF